MYSTVMEVYTQPRMLKIATSWRLSLLSLFSQRFAEGQAPGSSGKDG
jgi:hypothetical protein